MEEVRRSDGTVMKCYRKISVCCKAATCELGIMCQVGEKIEAECKVCEGQGTCHLAFKEDALACEKIQAVLSDKDKKDDIHKVAEDMAMKLSFEDKMQICTCCERYNICGDLHNSKCPVLIKEVERALKEADEKKKEEKVVQFPVDMDEMQRNILVELLNARKECTDQNLLTARGCVAIIDALFYLVKEKPIWAGIDMGNPNGDRTGGLD